MEIYILLVLAIIMLYFITKVLFKKSKLVYCILIGIFLFLILALRETTIGKDLYHFYAPYFRLICRYNFEELVDFTKRIDSEFTFYLIDYFISRFTTNIHVYIAIISLPFIFVITRFIYKYSKNPLLSFLMFIALNYYCFAFSALRHTMAAAFLVIAYDFIIKKKKLGFLISVVLASLMHRSALIFLIAYPICNLKVRFKQIFLISISLFISLLLKNSFLNIIFTFIGDSRFTYYKDSQTDISLAFFAINLVIYLLMAYLYGNKRDIYENKVNLNLQFLCVCFAALTPMLAEMLRLSYFFGVFACCGLPSAISTSKYKSNQRFYNTVLAMILIAYFLNFTLINNELVPYVSILN